MVLLLGLPAQLNPGLAQEPGNVADVVVDDVLDRADELALLFAYADVGLGLAVDIADGLRVALQQFGQVLLSEARPLAERLDR